MGEVLRLEEASFRREGFRDTQSRLCGSERALAPSAATYVGYIAISRRAQASAARRADS